MRKKRFCMRAAVCGMVTVLAILTTGCRTSMALTDGVYGGISALISEVLLGAADSAGIINR